MSSIFSDKIVLVTGGTGSFGTKFIEVALKECNPRAIRIYSRDEMKQHSMAQTFKDERLRFFIGDVRDKDRLQRAMKSVDIVIHAAALKQVPACEYNPFEAVQTNILGAKNVIEAAIDNGVKRVIALSTDKAVNPVNLYGATKLVAEKLFVQGNSYSGAHGTMFSCVRYGNVVGSRGSVIPLFLEQCKTNVVTVTDKRMTRFWITLGQGVEFVIRCLDLMHGGEIFVPKIPSMRMVDLVQAIAPKCQVQVTGIRPGEKIHESLLADGEIRHTVDVGEMFVVEPQFPWWGKENWKNGLPLSEEFSYTSDGNNRSLSVTELRQLAGIAVAEEACA